MTASAVLDQGLELLTALSSPLDTNETINLRVFTDPVDNTFHTSPQSALDAALAKAAKHDVYFGVNPRAGRNGTKDGVRRVLVLHADFDVPKELMAHPARRSAWVEAKRRELQALQYPPSCIVGSGGGLYAYWLLRSPIVLPAAQDSTRSRRVAEVEAPLKAMVTLLGADPQAAELARILRVPGTLNHKPDYPDGPLPVQVLELDTERRYRFEDLAAVFKVPEPERRNGHAAPSERLANATQRALTDAAVSALAEPLAAAWNLADAQGNTRRHALALSVAGWLQKRGATWHDAEVVLHGIAERARDEELRDRLTTIKTTWKRAEAGQDVAGWSRLVELLPPAIAASIETVLDQALPTTWAEAGGPRARKWPAALATEALSGLAGDVVRAIEPHTEADPAALLLNMLAAFGNAVGCGPHFYAGEDRHCLCIWCVLVGETSRGRKGTSWSPIRALFEAADQTWALERITTGLSSGEGLIWPVRDAIYKEQAVKDERGRVTSQTERVLADPGVSDKRLLVLESEFASPMIVMTREGNTLSAVLRQAWDSGNLNTMVKTNPARATAAHVTICAHITREELLRHLTATEAANGFANRFLWVCVRRSKLLPDGGRLPDHERAHLARRLAEALDTARKIGEIRRGDEAAAAWRRVYGALSEGQPGLLGAVTSRAEAQVMRLSAIYAAMDGSALIGQAHLLAGLAVWQYCRDSAAYIFGDATGDPLADRVLALLREKGPLAKTEMWEALGRHGRADRLDSALDLLLRLGRVASEKRPPLGDGGRPSEVWRAL